MIVIIVAKKPNISTKTFLKDHCVLLKVSRLSNIPVQIFEEVLQFPSDWVENHGR